MTLREVVLGDSFEAATGWNDIRRYITWVALAAQEPNVPATDVLKRYNGGSFRGRYAMQCLDGLVGYFGFSQGTAEEVVSLTYFTLRRGEHLAERAINAVVGLDLPRVQQFELTIADENVASRHTAAKCGFRATAAYIWDETLGLHEQIYRRPVGIQ